LLLFVFEIGFLFPAEESNIKHPALQVLCERYRVIARNPDFDIEQFAVCSFCSVATVRLPASATAMK
jgi:hypothetical protein